MLVKTVLNHCYSFKRFVYGVCRFEETGGAVRVIVPIVPRKNSKPRCSGCGSSGSTYDRQPVRLFEFIPIWGLSVFFEYSMRRVSCATCKIMVESVPWATGKHQKTLPYLGFWLLSRILCLGIFYFKFLFKSRVKHLG